MNVDGKVVVVTGGANGIGRALCSAFGEAGARALVVADIDIEGAREVAAQIGGTSFGCDVTSQEQIRQLVERTEAQVGPIDIFCSNAGIFEADPEFDNAASAADLAWQRSWSVNVMAHVYAARALLPRMINRKAGYFLNTASAAGLLCQIGSAPYSTTKHAAIGFAESLAITHHDHGIRVSVLCPQGVDTRMLEQARETPVGIDGILSSAEVAQAALDGIRRESFLILPHARVAGYYARKASDYDRWLGGMVKLRRNYV